MKRKKIAEKEEEKQRKLEKKNRLEKHWEMLRWLTSFIDEHKVDWDAKDKEKEEKRKEWDSKNKDEKIEVIKAAEKKERTREEKISLANEKRKYWTEWKGGKYHPETTISTQPTNRTDEIDPSTPRKKIPGMGIKGNGGNPEMGEPTPSTKISPIVGEMKIGNAEIRYSHCAERTRRHFQIEVYKSYERSSTLGTIIEEKTPFRLPKIKIRGAGVKMSQPQAGVKGGGGDIPADEAPTKSNMSLGD